MEFCEGEYVLFEMGREPRKYNWDAAVMRVKYSCNGGAAYLAPLAGRGRIASKMRSG
jgi:hypothetical protein